MTTISPPSLDVPEFEKRGFSEADVHSTLFDPDMIALGYPRRASSQADGEYFVEQRTLALRRLRSQRATGRYDGLYVIGNTPVVLVEIKRYGATDSQAASDEAVAQLKAYALSDDFAASPPFLLLYSGNTARTRFFMRKTLEQGTLLDEDSFEELGAEPWSWERIRRFQLRGEFAQEQVDAARLREILLYHFERIENDLRTQVVQAIRAIKNPDSAAVHGDFGRWLLQRPEAYRRLEALYERKVAELGRDQEEAVVGELMTQAALNYLNKVFFLSLCEGRSLPGFYRILREFLPRSRSETSPTTAAVFLGLLRRRIHDTSGAWSAEEERAYRALRQELVPAISEHVITQNSWRELIRVAFDLAHEHFPLVYREDAFDLFRPSKDVLAELVYDLSTKSFDQLTNRHVGDIYQSLLSSRRRQQRRLGAFYTPHGDVEYMVSKLNLTSGARVLDPCMGSGHFLDGIFARLVELYAAEGISVADVYRRIVEEQIYGGDIDSFALSLAAIRLFLLSEEPVEARPNLFVHDMLLHSPERPQEELFRRDVERVAGADPELDELAPVDEVRFDAVVGNPPYGARKPEYKKRIYAQLYGARKGDIDRGSVGTGDGDTYGMFFANGIERLREGGRLCLITNDSFRTLTSHAALRRFILDRCKIVEILLTDSKHFEGVSFAFAGMAITTLERCSDPAARAAHVMRLVDYVRDPVDYWVPPPGRVHELCQEEYEALPETPFFVGVPRDVFEAAKRAERVRDVARGRQGLATADDGRFLASIEDVRVGSAGIAVDVPADERTAGIPVTKPYWVPFAKGEGFGEYWRAPSTVIDWSQASVSELRRRDKLPSGTSRRPRFQNSEYFFKPGLTYSVVSSGRISVRLLPAGAIFGHKGSAIFPEEGTRSLFLLGYLNSALATYFMKRLVNSTATADVGYVEKLPYRRPSAELEAAVVERVERIVAALQTDPASEIQPLRDEIDDLIFDLFEIRAARDEVRRFHRTVGTAEAQAAVE